MSIKTDCDGSYQRINFKILKLMNKKSQLIN